MLGGKYNNLCGTFNLWNLVMNMGYVGYSIYPGNKTRNDYCWSNKVNMTTSCINIPALKPNTFHIYQQYSLCFVYYYIYLSN